MRQHVSTIHKALGAAAIERTPIMQPDATLPKDSESKQGSKPDAKDDLKSLPLAEVEKQLGSSPDGLTQAEAQKRLTQYGPNEIEALRRARIC